LPAALACQDAKYKFAGFSSTVSMALDRRARRGQDSPRMAAHPLDPLSTTEYQKVPLSETYVNVGFGE
jgi:hypothetical protein